MSDSSRSASMNQGTNRDANDEKVMANSMSAPGGPDNRTIEASQTTLDNTPASKIDTYFAFPSSNVVAKDTYSTRMDKIASYLGNKDEVKG